MGSKKSLETTGHNIANANTDGYSRQKVVQTTNVPITKGGLIHGTGSRITGVTRVHNEFVEKRLRDSTSSNEFYQNRMEQLEQVEQIFNELDGEGLNQVINRFFNSMRDLANQPENETIRSVVRDSAKLIIKDFQRIRSMLDTLSRNVDNQVYRNVEDINMKVEQLGKTNKKIAELEAIHEETGDLRDRRDLLIKELSQIIDIHTYSDEKGQFVVSSNGVGTLVTGGETQKLVAQAVDKESSSSNMAGSVDVFFENRANFPISNKFKKGSMAGAIKVRNQDIRTLQESVDKIAFEFANTVNAIHRRGYVNRKLELDANGKPLSDGKGQITGINFFAPPDGQEGFAANISLSSEVKNDLTNIATALDPNSPGDNRVAIAISKLQSERLMAGGTATLEEHFLQVVGNVGLESGKAKLDQEQAEGLNVQAQTIRDRISGVSIDEEAANMVKFQHAYEAAAKIMQTADEMFKTVINIKR